MNGRLYYLGEDAILPNVNTYLASEPVDCKFILENIEKLVVKSANEAKIPVIAYDAPGPPMLLPREWLVPRGDVLELLDDVRDAILAAYAELETLIVERGNLIVPAFVDNTAAFAQAVDGFKPNPINVQTSFREVGITDE